MCDMLPMLMPIPMPMPMLMVLVMLMVAGVTRIVSGGCVRYDNDNLRSYREEVQRTLGGVFGGYGCMPRAAHHAVNVAESTSETNSSRLANHRMR